MITVSQPARRRVLGVALAAVTLGGCAASPKFDPSLARSAQYEADLPSPGDGAPPAARKDYRIGPNDRLSVKVYGVPDLDREVDVDGAGNIQLPLIGIVPAMGETAFALSDKVAALYGTRYIRNPQVSILIKEALSSRALVDGAVAQPGEVSVNSSSTLMSTIASARGVTDKSKLDQVLVFRTIDGKRMVARFDLDSIRLAKAPDPAIYPNDVIVVGRGRGGLETRDILLLAPVLSSFYQLTR
ncbi:MAG TPA: polysaccharide biosynthesis/export family protein [Chakrabartia sp.]|nr:polysaccharide biosynthesis/export family protein [Chakrabartia sp.]